MITWLILFSQICFLYGREIITPDVKIKVQYPPPNFIKNAANGTITISSKRGDHLVMMCSVTNKPTQADAKILWKHYSFNGSPYVINTGTTSNDQSRYKISQGLVEDTIRIEIPTVDESYIGFYACEVQYSGDVENAKAEILLNVYDPPSMSYTEFQTSIQSNKDVSFDCQAKGFPTPVVYWKRIGGLSNIIKEMGVVSFGNKLQLTKVTHKDSGVYACVAENIYGKLERKFQLSVMHSPIVNIFPSGQDSYQKLGCMIQLTCHISANPRALGRQWTSRLKGTLKDDSRITMKYLKGSDNEGLYYLRIYPSYKEDFEDEYTCTAKNLESSFSKSIKIRQSDKGNPQMTGKYVCSSCQHQYSIFALSFSIIMCVLKNKFIS